MCMAHVVGLSVQAGQIPLSVISEEAKVYVDQAIETTQLFPLFILRIIWRSILGIMGEEKDGTAALELSERELKNPLIKQLSMILPRAEHGYNGQYKLCADGAVKKI